MRKIVFLFCVISGLLVNTLYSQTTKNFNYQAVVRNSDGDLITNQTIEVQLSIIELSIDGNEVYSESHLVTTSKQGVINLQVGDGTSSLADFSNIDWSVTPKFIKIGIDAGNGLTDLGTVQLLSVPYAMYAGAAVRADVLGSASVYTPTTDTLFVVKDHDGNVVFAVFPDGAQVIVNQTAKGKVGGFAVSGRSPSKADLDILRITPDSTRIYVNDTVIAKGKVGGFAVSGRSPSKGISENILYVTADSTRVYVNESLTKAKVGGFAVSGRSPSKGVISDYMQVTKDSTRIYVTDPVGKGKVGGFAVSGRSPSKGIDIDYFNISPSATAQEVLNESRIMWYPEKSALLAGELNIPSQDSVGEYSVALGYRNNAIGDWSQAMGYKSVARGSYATAIGYETVADTNSFAFGYSAKALGNDAVALGSGALALADKSFAFGSMGIDSLGNVTGVNTTATGEYSYAIGLGCEASNKGAFAIGANNLASGEFSTAVGYNTTATKWFSTAMGARTQATGWYSTAMGFYSIASQDAAIAIGYGTNSTGYGSLAMGVNAAAGGSGSISLGTNTQAQGNYAVAFGSSSEAVGANSVALGQGNTATGEWSFAAGASTSATNMLTTAFGNGTVASCYNTFVLGAFNAEIGNTGTFLQTNPLLIVGNGTDDAARSNALELDWTGALWVAGGFDSPSDSTLKENIEPINNVLIKVKQINPVYFNFKNDKMMNTKRQIGFIAQNVQPYFPELITTRSNGKLSMDYSKMTAVLLQAIKEQQEIIEEQGQKQEDLKNQVKLLNEKIEKILVKLENK